MTMVENVGGIYTGKGLARKYTEPIGRRVTGWGRVKFSSFWGMTAHHCIVGYPHFKITHWFQFQCSWTFRLLSMRQLRCLETPGTVNTVTLCYIP